MGGGHPGAVGHSMVGFAHWSDSENSGWRGLNIQQSRASHPV